MASADPFKSAEDQFLLLKGQLAAGRITREQFETALKDLMVQDAQGRYWMLGPDSGKWYVHDAKTWVEAQPSAASRRVPAAPPVSRAQPPRSSNIPLVATGIVAALCLLVVMSLLFAAYAGIVKIGQASPTNTPSVRPISTEVSLASATIPPPTPIVIVVTATPPPTSPPSPTVIPTPTQTATPLPPSPTATQPLPSPTVGPQKRLDATFNGGLNGINIVDLATNVTFKVYGEPGIASAAWSPDGSKVLVSSSAPPVGTLLKRVLRTVNADGSNVRNILLVTCEANRAFCTSWGPFEAIWSPDGQRILVRELTDLSGLFLKNAIDGQALSNLPSSPPVLERAMAADIPRFWSVDGNWVIVVSSEPGHFVYALEVNGNRRVPVSSLGGIKVYDQRFYPWKVIAAPANCPSHEYFYCP